MSDLISSLFDRLLGWINPFKPRFYISTSSARCREKVQRIGSGNDVIMIRASVENFGWHQTDPPPCEVRLVQIRFNDLPIEKYDSRLNWTDVDSYYGAKIIRSNLIDMCSVDKSDKPTLVVESEKGKKGYGRYRDPGVYKFDLVTACKDSTQGRATITVSFDGVYWENVHIVSVRSRAKWRHWAWDCLVLVVLLAAAWYWPDFWKPHFDEKSDVAKHAIPIGSEWRHGTPKESFTFARLDFPDASSTFPTSINDGGDIVGIYQDSRVRQSFTRRRDGSFASFEYPGTTSTTNATGINNNNEIVGFYYDTSTECHGSPAHGFMRKRDGTYNSFNYPGSLYTFVHGINDKGEIVGAYEDCDGIARGFLLRGDGSFLPIDHPGAASTVPTGINNSGEIVGYWRDPKFGDRGFLRYGDGTFIPIMPDPTTSANPKGINNSGDLVGSTSLGAFIRRKDGTLILLEHPACLGSSCITSTSINSHLEVAGHYQVSGGNGVHAFLARASGEQGIEGRKNVRLVSRRAAFRLPRSQFTYYRLVGTVERLQY